MATVEVLLTLSEVEQRLGYARGSLTSLRAKGYMPEPDNHYGRTPLWRVSTVDAWAESRRKVIK